MVTCMSFLFAALAAGEPVGSPDGEAIPQPAPGQQAEVDPAAVSPVRLIPRIEVRHGFAQLTNGASVNTSTAQIDVLLLRRALLRYELPLPRVATGDAQIAGVGDVRLQTITMLTSRPRQVTVLIAGLVLDTASRPQLGAGKQQVFFGGAAAVKPRPWWLPYLIAQEQLSVAGDSARPGVNQLLVRIGNIVFVSRAEWFKLDLDTAADFHDRKGRLFGALEAGSLFRGSVGLFLRGGSQLLGPRALDFNLEAGVRYLFGLEPPR
jgi:hypothetical protein